MSAAASPQPVASPCQEKQELQEDILRATSVIAELRNREVEASKALDFAMLKIVRAELRTARQWKDHMVADLVRHIRTHGC